MRVRELREKAYLSQQQLADKAGLTKSAIFKLETGRIVNPHGVTLRRIADALGVDPSELIVRD